MADNSILHLRDRLPKEAPRINLQQGRFLISVEEFEVRLNEICCELWKIKQFAKFAVDNFKNIEERHLVHGDIYIIYVFMKKEFIDPKSMFKKTCRQFPFEFLLIFDFCRE